MREAKRQITHYVQQQNRRHAMTTDNMSHTQRQSQLQRETQEALMHRNALVMFSDLSGVRIVADVALELLNTGHSRRQIENMLSNVVRAAIENAESRA